MSALQAIKNYLDNRAACDPQFAVAYARPGKSINECLRYITSEARKLGGDAVVMTDEQVYGLAVHYYDEENVKVPKHTPKCKVMCSADKSKKSENRAAPAKSKKQTAQPQQAYMSSLFDFDEL